MTIPPQPPGARGQGHPGSVLGPSSTLCPWGHSGAGQPAKGHFWDPFPHGNSPGAAGVTEGCDNRPSSPVCPPKCTLTPLEPHRATTVPPMAAGSATCAVPSQLGTATACPRPHIPTPGCENTRVTSVSPHTAQMSPGIPKSQFSLELRAQSLPAPPGERRHRKTATATGQSRGDNQGQPPREEEEEEEEGTIPVLSAHRAR